MTVLVTDKGFAPAPELQTVTLAELSAHKGAVDLL